MSLPFLLLFSCSVTSDSLWHHELQHTRLPCLFLKHHISYVFALPLFATGLYSIWWLTQYRICLQCKRPGFYLWVRKIPWRRKRQPTVEFLPGEFHGQTSLVVGYSLQDSKESDIIEWLTLSLFSYSEDRNFISFCSQLYPLPRLLMILTRSRSYEKLANIL